MTSITTDLQFGAIMWQANSTELPNFIYRDINNAKLLINNGDDKRELSDSVISFQHHGERVVWSKNVEGESKIFFVDGATSVVQQISGDLDVDKNPHVSKTHISWERETIKDGVRYSQVHLFDGEKVRKISDFFDANEHSSSLVGNEVLYLANPSGNDDVFYFDGSENIQLTDTPVSEVLPIFSKDRIVWAGDYYGDYIDGHYNANYSINTYNGVNTNEIFVSADNVFSIGIDRDRVIFDVEEFWGTKSLYLWQNGEIHDLGLWGRTNSYTFVSWTYDIKSNYLVVAETFSGHSITEYDTYFYRGLNMVVLRTNGGYSMSVEPQIFGNYILFQDENSGLMEYFG